MSYAHRGHAAEFDEEFDEEIEDERPGPRPWVAVLVCLMLVATGSGTAFLWHNSYGDVFPDVAWVMPSRAVSVAAVPQDALLKGLAEAQQRMAAIAQRNQELLQAQDAQIKRLSESVAQMATRLDALSARNAQAFIPPPAPKKPAAPKVVAPKPAAPAPISLAPESKQAPQAKP